MASLTQAYLSSEDYIYNIQTCTRSKFLSRRKYGTVFKYIDSIVRSAK